MNQFERRKQAKAIKKVKPSKKIEMAIVPERHEYLPPNRTAPNESYMRRWKSLLGKVTDRDNFDEAHLIQLETLCDLYEEYEDARATIELLGSTYESRGAQGSFSIKPRPEVSILNNCRQQIGNYLKMLGITLTKDKALNSSKEKKAKTDWE